MSHSMSPTGVAVLLLLALVTDYMSVGPDSLRDRLAFLMGLAAIREGFNGSPLDQWTVGALSNAIDSLKAMASGAYIAGAVTSVLLAAGVGILAIYTVGALLPTKFAGRLGRFAAIQFPTSALHRINVKLWVCAILLGMLADLPQGLVGSLVTSAVNADVALASTIPALLFQVS